ncbi:MAG: 2-oxo-3-hexenedioate decarboxylase [Gammaproteobacteria bacterium]|nr:2-oxo-3-hexenedioate decarboxylase [Gammaproteobacteria bacterium]
MAMQPEIIRQLATHLDAAECDAREVVKITDAHPSLTLEDAYAVQEEIRNLKQARGQSVVGLKAGLTSPAKMRQMGVEVPVFGILFDYMQVADGGDIRMESLIHPKVEAEIAFVLKHALRGPGCTGEAVLAATSHVVPAAEIIDSRYENFRFDLASVVADNTSASRFVIGCERHPATGLDLAGLRIEMRKNGEVVAAATGAAVLGHPAEAVAALANHLATRGQEIPAGACIMSGGATEAVPVVSGDVIEVRVEGLGQVTLHVLD